MLTIGSVVWGVKRFREAVDFWSAALDYEPRRPHDDTWALLRPRTGQRVQLALQLVTSDAASHQRHHLDLYADDQAAEVERLIGLGATRVDWRYPPGADYVVLADPDGNRFCVIDTGEGAGEATSEDPHAAGNVAAAKASHATEDSFAHRGARALIALQERELRTFLTVWRAAKARNLALPETDDDDYDSLEHLLRHVIRASGRYITWICRVLELPDPGVPREPPLDETAANADDYLEGVLATWREPLRDVPPERYDDRTYTSNWGVQLTIESMLEHAVAHPMRHVFQLRELLAQG